jgi:small-conductance mechanosensitive channel
MTEMHNNFNNPHCTLVIAGRSIILNLLPRLQETALHLFWAKFYKYLILILILFFNLILFLLSYLTASSAHAYLTHVNLLVKRNN